MMSYLDKLKNSRGFTLIELLVVIAIIGILSSVVLASLNGARESARDARRQSDLSQIRTGMTLYKDAEGVYPSNLSDLENEGHMSQVPTDPSTGDDYDFATSSTDYDVCLHASMEGETAPDGSADSICGSMSTSTGDNEGASYYIAI